MQRVVPVSMFLLLLNGPSCVSASGGLAHKLATHIICVAVGATAAVSAKPDALYRKIDQTIRRLNGKKDDGVNISASDASTTRTRYVEFEKKFNSKCSPLTLDKTARVSIGISTYLITLQVLSFLS